MPEFLAASSQARGVPPSRRAAAGAPPGLPEPLTDRETDVLRLIAAGKSNQRIAHELVVTLDTVKSTSATSWASSAPPIAPRP